MKDDLELCACCQSQIISETNPKAQYLDLCDDCFDKLFKNDSDDFIGWNKWE